MIVVKIKENVEKMRWCSDYPNQLFSVLEDEHLHNFLNVVDGPRKGTIRKCDCEVIFDDIVIEEEKTPSLSESFMGILAVYDPFEEENTLIKQKLKYWKRRCKLVEEQEISVIYPLLWDDYVKLSKPWKS